MASLLIIEHPDTGERYAVSDANYRRLYQERGFVAVRHEDGSEYTYKAPATKSAPAKKATTPSKSE